MRAYGPLQLDPAAAVLHYGQEIFEGIKAYRHADGSIWTFRPDANGRRLQRSAQRLALPELPVEIFVESLKQLIAVDSDWVPSADESSLYFRPFMIGDEAFLGVRGAHKAGYYVIASPAGPYFAKGVAPVSIWLSTEYACGQGRHRCCQVRWQLRRLAAAAAEGAGAGCSQVLFLDPVEGKYLEELGGMNVFLVYKDGTLVTRNCPAASSRCARESILQLARDRGMKVEERKVSIDEWKDGVASGAISEVFACGTAAVVTPIGQLKGEGFSVGDINAPAGEVTIIAAQGTDRHPVRTPAGPPQLAGPSWADRPHRIVEPAPGCSESPSPRPFCIQANGSDPFPREKGFDSGSADADNRQKAFRTCDGPVRSVQDARKFLHLHNP